MLGSVGVQCHGVTFELVVVTLTIKTWNLLGVKG